MTFPQLRIRTEFAFKQAFGPVPRVAAALADLQCPAAAIVDGGTWGHVRWQKALKDKGIKPLFGTELAITQEDGRKPVAWALAEDTRAFYRFSTAARQADADIEQLFRESPGIIRFAGAALTDPDTFDFIDINPGSKLQTMKALALAKKTGKPLVITSDNAYPTMADFPAFMTVIDRQRETPQHIMTERELFAHFVPMMGQEAYAKAMLATYDIAERCAFELPTAPLINVAGDLRAMAEAGRQYRLSMGHLKSWPEEYAARLERELVAIEQKEFQSYFIVVADLIAWAKERMLVGPGRGSSAGSLLCYLIGITEVDPIPHHLLFERFIDLTRKDLPDIDIDFNDSKRDEVFTYLAEKYGRDNVARLGNINTLKPKSVLAAACKRFDIPDKDKFDLVNVLEDHSSGSSLYGKGLLHALETTDPGRRFMERYPQAMVMTQTENHASHTGVHAAGVIVCNVPVNEFCTIGPDGVAHIDKPDSEALNLLKIDALGLRTLGVIEDSGVVTAEKLYGLTLDDPRVMEVFNSKKFCGIFQFEGQAQRTVSAQVLVNDFQTIDHITALSRPGPLGGGAAQKYINRHAGREPVVATHPKMQAVLEDTYGVVLYQEQVMRIVREIGKFSWEDTTIIRKAMSGRKGEEFFNKMGVKFIEGAAQDGIDKATAETIWLELCSFGAWGMNKSHTCAYSVISYWCAWMKAYHPLEYAASCLRHAKDDDQTMEILREMAQEGIAYTPFDIEKSDVNWSVQGGMLVGGFMNLVGFGPAKSWKAVQDRAAGKLNHEKVLAAEVKFAQLYPLAAKYRDWYHDPESKGCRAGSRILTFDRLPESGDCLIIGKVVEKKLRDKNEAVLIKRRDGKKWTRGPSAFADFVLKDDTGIPMICRVEPEDFADFGQKGIEQLVVGSDEVLIRGKRVPGFSMIKIQRMKCLNRPEVFE